VLGCAAIAPRRAARLPPPETAIRSRTRRAVLFISLAIALAAGGCGRPGRTADTAADSAAVPLGNRLYGVELPAPGPKPSFTLVDTHGRRYDFARETAGKLTFLFFGYTHCPDICPVHMANLAAVIGKLPRADADRIRVVFVTTDPVRDTPARLRQWLDAFDPAFVGLTGTKAELMDAQVAAGVAPSVAQPAPGDTAYEVGHAAQVIAYTPDDRMAAQYPFGTRQKEWAHDLPRLLARGGPDLLVQPGYARITPARDGGAGYFTVINRGSAGDTLVALAVAGGTNAELHATRPGPGGIMRMVRIDRAPVVPRDTLRLAEGGHHLMFDLPAGSAARDADSLDVTLTFSRSGDRAVRLPVRSYGVEGD
jgi:protein SCO1/2